MSEHDDAQPGPDATTGADPDTEDTRPIGPPPSAPGSQDAEDTRRFAPPPYTPAAPAYPAPPGYGAPYPPPSAPYGPAAAQPAGRMPGWAWPVIAVTALVLGLLGGVLGGVAVSTSMGGDTLPVIDTDNGAAAPLAADNGSVAAVAQRLLPSTVQILANGGADGLQQGGATGSGFVLDDKGHVITNNHVVADATGDGELEVVDQHGRRHDARIVGRSPVYDIAVLAVDGGDRLRPASLGSSRSMHVGETVVAFGSPLGLSSTVTSGIVSALDRPVTTGSEDESSFINAVQTDAAINPGNSGGPLVNMRGQVVGVNSAIATTGGALGAESGSIGVGFAIPMEQVRITAGQILATGEARYPVIGANVNTSREASGAEVVGVPTGTPAASAGLREGDVVVSLDGKPIADGIGLIVAIRSHQPGEKVTLTVDRDGHRERITITLDSKVG